MRSCERERVVEERRKRQKIFKTGVKAEALNELVKSKGKVNASERKAEKLQGNRHEESKGRGESCRAEGGARLGQKAGGKDAREKEAI